MNHPWPPRYADHLGIILRADPEAHCARCGFSFNLRPYRDYFLCRGCFRWV